jgi:tetraacyldisaccharide 4'-kinase
MMLKAPEFWYRRPGAASIALLPAAALWRVATWMKRRAARPLKLDVPVICVGNLTVGGTGKTPIVQTMGEMLVQRGRNPHVVMRGYGGRYRGPVRVDPVRHSAEDVGDEPLLLAAGLPVWVSRDRAAGARAAIAQGADLILLDDGHQNLSLHHDLSFVVVDGQTGFGNGCVVPAGPLRESIGQGLARTDAVILMGEGDVEFFGPKLRARLSPVGGEALAGARAIAFAGIGRPEKFFETLRATGAELIETVPFPDHHAYDANEIAHLSRRAAKKQAILVTTQKDWVRLEPPYRQNVACLMVRAVFDDSGAIERILSGL